MRRVVLTPTFAAGLGVVVAAVLAYPMQTVFNYASPNSATCKVASCGIKSQTGGLPASGPAYRLNTPGSGGTDPGSGGAGHAQAGGERALAAAPQLSYRTSSKARWDFAGMILITFKPKFAHQRWWLRFSYPSARILKVWADGYIHIHRHGTHTAVVGTWDSPGHGTFPLLVRVSIEVAGRPGPPRQCSFNGRDCHFGERHAGQGGPPAGAQGHQPQGAGHKAEGGQGPKKAERGRGHKKASRGHKKAKGGRGHKKAHAVS
jgi:hypothetical protein